jgi:phosphate starvation-inducible protein PhoH and related proteins
MTKRNSVNGDTKKRPKAASRIGIQNVEIRQIQPMTMAQRHAFEGWEEGLDLLFSGYAGTGKTFIATYFALTTGLKVYIVRSAVPTRDMGFMPGNAKEKASLYEGPYVDACTKLFGRGDAYSILTTKGVIEFVTTSYLRGLTLDNCVVIVDEMQNMNFHELDTIITRCGVNCRLIFLGDVTQTDLTRNDEKAGLKKFMSIIEKIDGFEIIDFGVDDIVRSDKVKQYIIAKDKLLE